MKNKYVSMKKKVRYLILIVSVVVLLIGSFIALIVLFRMQYRANEIADTLGNYAAEEGENTVLDQAKQSAVDLVSCKAMLAQGDLEEYGSYVHAVKLCIENLYKTKESYTPFELVPREQYKNGTATTWLALRDQSFSAENLNRDIGFLGNIQSVLTTIYEENDDIVGNIYFGTEAGYMIGYGNNPEGIPEYFNFPERIWYSQTKEKMQMTFTDIYLDAFGYGLMVTCAIPFNDEKGNFAGVVGIDIPLDQLNNSVMGVNMGENSYVLIVDENGNIIASPKIDKNNTNFRNIKTNTESKAYEAADTIMSGETGITLTSAGIYYAYAPIEVTGWTAVIHYEPGDITAPITAMHTDIDGRKDALQDKMKHSVWNVSIVFVFILIIMSFAVVLISKVFANHITKPLILMTDTVKDVGYIGGMSAKILVDSKDEISDLADAFNEMRESLENYIREITDLASENERVSAELDIATRIQADMLPNDFPYLPERKEFDLYASMQPAKKVGGDFYDFFMVDDDHLAIVMADVSGKGIPAALFMVVAKTLIKNAAQQGLSSHDVLESVNRQLCENNKEEMFVTVWIGILDIRTGVMTCSNAGHEFPALRRKGGKFELLKNKHGFVLAGMETTRYSQYDVRLEPGDSIFVYTDGIPEAINVHEEMFGTARMLDALNKSSADCQDILAAVRSELDEFVGLAPQFDDMTMLALIYQGNTVKNDQEHFDS